MPEIKCLKCLEEVFCGSVLMRRVSFQGHKFTRKPFKPNFYQTLLFSSVYPWSPHTRRAAWPQWPVLVQGRSFPISPHLSPSLAKSSECHPSSQSLKSQNTEQESFSHKLILYNTAIMLSSLSHCRSTRKDTTLLNTHLRDSVERLVLFLPKEIE